MTDSKTKQIEVAQARERNIIRVEKGTTITVTPQVIFAGNSELDRQSAYADKNTRYRPPVRTPTELASDIVHSIDSGVNSAVNNVMDGVTSAARNSVNFGTALMNVPRASIGSLLQGESPLEGASKALSQDYVPSTTELQQAIKDAINLVPTDEYTTQKQPYLSDTLKFQESELNKQTSSNSEVQNLLNTIGYYRDNPSYLFIDATRELADMGASAAMGGALGKAVGVTGKLGGAIIGDTLGSYGSAINDLNARGVDVDSSKALATASSIAAVNALTQRAFNTKYSPENVIDNLLKVSANSSSKLINPSRYAGKTLTGIMAEGTEEAIQAAYETGAINLASGDNITSGMGRNVGEGIALGSTLGGISSMVGSASEYSNTDRSKQTDPNMLNPKHRKYNPTAVITKDLANTQSSDSNVRQQAQSNITKTFNDAHTHFNSLVSEMNNETDETKKKELKNKVVKHYNEHISPLHSSFESYSKIADTGINLGEIFTRNQELNAKRLASIQEVSQEYSPYLDDQNRKVATNPSQPVQVATMGDYAKGDTGIGNGDHYDLRLVKVNGKRGDINPYLDRFMVNGKPLNTYNQTGKFGDKRKGYTHEGVDYGINGAFNEDLNARKIYVNPEYQVTDIKAFDNNKHGGGWVTQVTFSDGIKVNILHQNKEGAQSVADAFKSGTSTTNTQTSKLNVNTTWTGRKHRDIGMSDQYDGLLQEVYSKYGYTAEEQKILKAQIGQESNFDINAVSASKAFGLTQFIPSTAQQYGVRKDDARSQIEGQAKYMKDLLNRYNGDWAKALAAYNTGTGNVDKHWGSDGTGKGGGVMTSQWSGGTGETLKYVENILAHANVSGMSGTSSSYQFDDSNSELEQLNNLLNQWEQEEANATNEAERAKLQEQIDTLKSKLEDITNVEKEEESTKQEARQAFAVEFNPNLAQEEIDNNPFLSDKEKEEYKQTLEVVQEIESIKPNEYTPESPEVIQRIYDDIEQEFQTNQSKQDDTKVQSTTDTGLIDNEPIFTQRFSLSNTTPEEIDSNPKLTDNQKRAIHKMMDVQRQVADTRNVQGVTNDIIVGSVGNTISESNRGLQDYITGFENAINANNIKAASDLLTDLQYLRDTRISKNNAINQALQLVEHNSIKDINDAPIIAQDADTKEWFVTEYTGLREGYPEFDGSNALTIFKPNKLTERLDKEAKLVDDFTNAWVDYLADYNIEGTQAPTLDTSLATVSSKTNNRVTRSYDEAEATFQGKELTKERVKSELPPLTETNRNPVNVKAGKIQLIQDINQVPKDGTFLGRGKYINESGKSRPTSMYDMEQGRINVGDAGWLASPYNAPKQGYTPNSFTLADNKPSTHAEAYGGYFKRMFMQDDGFAKEVLQLEPSKLYRTKYSTTEAQFIDSFLQSVPKESVENARAWVTDKVYKIENGKPVFKVSTKTDSKPKAETKKVTKPETKENIVDENIYVDTSEELTDFKLDKDTLVSLKSQLTSKPVSTGKTESKVTEVKDTPEETNTDTDSNEVTNESNLTGFKKESTTVNSVFNITPEQVAEEKAKHWQSQNHLILGFKQEGDKPLVNILDLASNLENDLSTGIRELLPNSNATEVQLKQVKHFLKFNKAFVNALKNSYHKEAISADGRDYSFRDFKGYLQKEDGSFDENILTALSLATYSHFIVNNKEFNLYKDIAKLLNYPDEVSVPADLLDKYKYRGDRYNNVVNSIGRTAYDLLGLKTNKDVSELYRGRMIASLGNWVASSIVNVGLMYESTIPTSELNKDMYNLEGDDNDIDDASTVTFLSFTDNEGNGKKTFLDDVKDNNKGTQGFLGKLFGGDVGLRSPTLEPAQDVNRDIRGTTAKVSDTQAKLQKHMQQEPIVINNDSFNGLHKLVEKFPKQAKTMIGAYISKDALDSMHESKRVGAEAKVEGTNKELERLIGFTSGLDMDEDGNYLEFFDSVYTSKNNRGLYNSNEVNMQTMKLHRAMVDYKNFEQVIEADTLSSITGTETDFVVDGELTDLGHLFSAIAENAEGTEDAIESMLSHLTYRRGFTVDKVRAEDFLPAFFEHLETSEDVQNAVTSVQKLLNNKEVKQSDMDNIQLVVDAWDMKALSFRALVEYAKFKQAQKDNDDLLTSFGLGSDGVNNGSAISYTLMGLLVNKNNPDFMNQVGIFTEESGFRNFHETRLKGLNDYYEGLATIMNEELSTYKRDKQLQVNLLYRLNPSIKGRKGAKEILMPAGYGAGVNRLQAVAFESLISDLTNSYESIHNRNKNLEANKGSMSEAKYNNEMGSIVKDYNELQDDLRAVLDDRGFNLPHPKEMLDNDAFLTKDEQKKLRESYDGVIGELIIKSFNKYALSYNTARKANTRFHTVSSNIYLTLYNAQLDKALKAKKEKIKESLDATHKELVQNRLDSINARRKDKEDITYEDMLDTMAKDQLEFEGLTKQEYREQVEKPLLEVFPTLNTAFNYEEPKHKRKLSDIRILKSKTTTVDVFDSYQMKTKDRDGKVKYKKASILTQEWVHAGLVANSGQVQSVDARVAFEASAMNGNVSLDVHDNVIAGKHNYVPMVRVLNKKFYETTRDYHANLASVNAFLDTLTGLINTKEEIGEEVFNSTMVNSLIEFLGFNQKEKEAYLDATLGEFDEIMPDVVAQVIHEVEMAIQRDIQKLKHYENVAVVHQYAGYGGQYELTAEDKVKEKQELEKLEKIKKSIKERVVKLLPKASKSNNINLKRLASNNFINHTGGAYGADTAWDLVGREFGVTNHKHYRAEGAEKLSKGLKDKGIKAEVISKEHIDYYRNEVNVILDRDYKDDYAGNLQARDYAQVINSDAIYAIATLNKNLKGVTGGTNTAVQLAIKLGKPVHVWDVNTSQWYTFKGVKFSESDTPRLTKNFAGVGTRDIEDFKVFDRGSNKWVTNPKYLGDTVRDAALSAIRDVYNNSIADTTDDDSANTQESINIGSVSDENAELSKKALPTTGNNTLTHKQDKGILNVQSPKPLMGVRSELAEQAPPRVYTLGELVKKIDNLDLRDGSAESKLFGYLAFVFNKNKDIKVIFTDNLPNSSVEGMYDNKTNTIYYRNSIINNTTISKDKKIRLINHELLHALTETGLRLGKANNSKAYQDLTKMYEQIKAKADGRFTKELADINEFIAYGLTDAKFRAFINDNLDAKDISIKGIVKDVLTKFLGAVHSILGFSAYNNFDKFVKTVDRLIVPYEPIQGTEALRHSASTMKSNEANIRRGMKAMNQVITTKADKKRAMYRNDIGWIDFVWGSTGVLKASGKTKGAMGISHIIKARMRKDGMDYREVTRILTEDIVKTIALGVEYKRNTAPDGKSFVLKIRHNGYEANLVKNLGSNAWVLTGYELHDKDVPNGGDRVGGDTSNPTHITPTRTRDNVGAFGTFKKSDGDVVKSIGSSTSTHTTSILHRDGMGASDKNSIAPKDIPFKQRYSQSDITSDMSTVEVIQSLDSSMIDSEHNQRLDNLTQRIIGTFGINSKQDNIVDNDKILQSDALVHGFKMSDKEIAVYNSLHAVFTTMENHRANQNYQSLVRLYNDAKKQLTYKDFIATDKPTKEDISEAKSKYDYVFNSVEHLNDRIAVFASLGLANEEMATLLQKPRQVRQREVESWFDKLMTIFDKVFKALTEQTFFKGGKDFHSQLDVLSNKLLKVDADVRANKQALHDVAWQKVSLVTTPLNKAIQESLNYANKKLSKLEGSSNPHLSNLGKLSEEFVKIKDSGNQAGMLDIIKQINDVSSSGKHKELGELINEAAGLVGDTSKVIMDKVLRLTQSIGKIREKEKQAVIQNLRSYFPNKGNDLTKEETSAVTRALLRTDVSSLLNDDNREEVHNLITNDDYRQSTITELHSLVSSFNLSIPKTNGIIMSAMDLAAYLAKEEVPNNLYKNAEGIARFYGQEGNTKLIEAIDKLATLQALEYVDRKDLITVKNMMKSYPDAMWNVLDLYKSYTTYSKEQEFKYNKYSYQKGYLPQKTNRLRSLVHAKDLKEVAKLKEEGWELLTQSPEGMKQDNADLTTPRYLMFHKNSNYRDYNSGALDMSDTHTKGSVIYTYRDHKDITRYIKDKDILMARRNTSVNPKDYNPFDDTGNMVMAYDPNGAIINVHYEMRGKTRDKYLERDNNFIELMGLYVSGINAKPLLTKQQADVAKLLYQDYKLNYRQRPHEFVILDPKSKDEKTLETLRLMPYSFKVEAERYFGKNQPIIVKKSIFLMTFGYKQLSLGDLFDKHFDDLGAFSKTFVKGSEAILGKKAKGRIMLAEYFVSRLTTLFADIVVIRNPEVLKGNIISNSLMLMLRGVNPVDVIRESIRVWKQGRDYVELENELYALKVKYNTAKDTTQIEKDMKDLYARMERHPLSTYFKQGLMSSIVEGYVSDDTDTYGSYWEEKLDTIIDTHVPKRVREGVDFFMMNKGSPLHNMMASATQFSDFSAKIILIEHLKKQGYSEKNAIAEAQDTFINFDIPSSPLMDYGLRMGLMTFMKFFIRFQKALIKAIGRTPASVLLQHTLVEKFTNEAGILDPFVFNRLGNNPFDLAPLSLPDASDDVLTMQVLDSLLPDIF